MGFSSMWPTDLIVRLLEFEHVSTQLPWWGSIVALTLIIRVAMFPLMLKVTRNASIAPYMLETQSDILAELKEARASNEMTKMKVAQNKLMDLYRTWGYSPFVNFFGLVQIPFFIAMFRGLNQCATLPVPGFQTGGALWFTDLTAIDPFLILPIISGVTTSATVLVNPDVIELIADWTEGCRH